MPRSQLLILTTNASTRQKLKSGLSPYFDLSFSDSGFNALARLRSKIPDAIIMDHSLEDFKANDFIDKIRNKPITRKLPFIMVSRESTNFFVEQAVRGGVSHYIGIPFETEMLVEKIKFAMVAGNVSSTEEYFRVPSQFPTQITSFGRISYISASGLHFETHLKLEKEQKLSISSPLSAALNLTHLSVIPQTMSSDVYYNYPFAVDADWETEEAKHSVAHWISKHRHLNSPKKLKILFVHSNIEVQEELIKYTDLSAYSLRTAPHLQSALESIPFMKPALLIVNEEEWIKNLKIQKQALSLFQEHSMKWVLFDTHSEKIETFGYPPPFIAPTSLESLALSIKQVIPPIQPDPDRLYFSKTLEDSRLKIYLQAKTLELGELGVKLALPCEVMAPCNFQLDLKTFTDQNLRNPFVRIWPPLARLSGSESEQGHYKFAVESHFLGINDQQGQAVRQWLRKEELKEKQKALESVIPLSGAGPEPQLVPLGKEQEPPLPEKKPTSTKKKESS